MPAATCDALIVGGGPAGSTCAQRLRDAGLDVLVMDKQPFPRDKVCAGWITPAVVESLGLDLDDYAGKRVLQPIRGFRIGTIGGAEAQIGFDVPVSYGIRRCEFDHYLLQRSKARLATGQALTSMVREGTSWLVNGSIRTPIVIGAGGHFCPVSRLLGAEPGAGARESIVVAQEAEFPLTARERADHGIEPEVAQLYFCPDLKGYGWCVAKGDYVNIGLGREDSHRLPEHVEQFREWLRRRGGMPHHLPGRFNGHAYVLYPESRRIRYGDGVLLVGDAAGLAYARSGRRLLAGPTRALCRKSEAAPRRAQFGRGNRGVAAAGAPARGRRKVARDALVCAPCRHRPLVPARRAACHGPGLDPGSAADRRYV